MENPLHQQIPRRLDRKIRWRLFLASSRKMLSKKPLLLVGTVAPIAAVLLILNVINTTESTTLDTASLVAAIRDAQVTEQARAETGIYHTKRIITEGADKPAFVASFSGVTSTAPVRTDTLETWQHDDTALALINSNATEYSFEAFLSLESEATVSLSHYGNKNQQVPASRIAYDDAHDLASLYDKYASIETPELPILPVTATFVRIDESTERAYFSETISDTLEIEYVVSTDTKLLIDTIIYVADTTGNRFEMSRISFLERDVLPADQFDEIFNPERFAFTQIL